MTKANAVTRVRKVEFPPESQLFARLPEAWYHDAFEAPLHDAGLTPAEIGARALAMAPGWVDAMLRLRDAMAAPFGVTPVARRGPLSSGARPAPKVGDRFSIFTVRAVDARELVLGIDDSHLDVRISFLKRMGDNPTYLCCAWVKTHNLIGRIYMLPVAPFHQLIVRMMMSGAAF